MLGILYPLFVGNSDRQRMPEGAPFPSSLASLLCSAALSIEATNDLSEWDIRFNATSITVLSALNAVAPEIKRAHRLTSKPSAVDQHPRTVQGGKES